MQCRIPWQRLLWFLDDTLKSARVWVAGVAKISLEPALAKIIQNGQFSSFFHRGWTQPCIAAGGGPHSCPPPSNARIYKHVRTVVKEMDFAPRQYSDRSVPRKFMTGFYGQVPGPCVQHHVTQG